MADEFYRFVINAYSPATIPMARLADYMADLATLMGEKAAVHFEKLEPSSTAVAVRVDREAQPKVDARVRGVSYRQAPAEAMAASERLDRRLRDDNADGYLKHPTGDNILVFPGVKRLVHTPYAPFWQAGHVTGYVVLVGNRTGKTSAIGRSRSFVHLEGTATYHCSAKRSVAMELRKYLLTDTPLRCSGQGRWERGADARWTLLEFDIERYEALKSRPLSEIMDELGGIRGRWMENPNPLDLLADDDTDDTSGKVQ